MKLKLSQLPRRTKQIIAGALVVIMIGSTAGTSKLLSVFADSPDAGSNGLVEVAPYQSDEQDQLEEVTPDSGDDEEEQSAGEEYVGGLFDVDDSDDGRQQTDSEFSNVDPSDDETDGSRPDSNQDGGQTSGVDGETTTGGVDEESGDATGEGENDELSEVTEDQEGSEDENTEETEDQEEEDQTDYDALSDDELENLAITDKVEGEKLAKVIRTLYSRAKALEESKVAGVLYGQDWESMDAAQITASFDEDAKSAAAFFNALCSANDDKRLSGTQEYLDSGEFDNWSALYLLILTEAEAETPDFAAMNGDELVEYVSLDTTKGSQLLSAMRELFKRTEDVDVDSLRGKMTDYDYSANNIEDIGARFTGETKSVGDFLRAMFITDGTARMATTSEYGFTGTEHETWVNLLSKAQRQPLLDDIHGDGDDTMGISGVSMAKASRAMLSKSGGIVAFGGGIGVQLDGWVTKTPVEVLEGGTKFNYSTDAARSGGPFLSKKSEPEGDRIKLTLEASIIETAQASVPADVIMVLDKSNSMSGTMPIEDPSNPGTKYADDRIQSNPTMDQLMPDIRSISVQSGTCPVCGQVHTATDPNVDTGGYIYKDWSDNNFSFYVRTSPYKGFVLVQPVVITKTHSVTLHDDGCNVDLTYTGDYQKVVTWKYTESGNDYYVTPNNNYAYKNYVHTWDPYGYSDLPAIASEVGISRVQLSQREFYLTAADSMNMTSRWSTLRYVASSFIEDLGARAEANPEMSHRMGIIVYSKLASTQQIIDLTDLNTEEGRQRAKASLHAVNYDGDTYGYRGLELAETMLQQSLSDQPDLTKRSRIVVFMTDGIMTDPKNASQEYPAADHEGEVRAINTAQKLKDKGASVFSVGVSTTPRHEFLNKVSSNYDLEHLQGSGGSGWNGSAWTDTSQGPYNPLYPPVAADNTNPMNARGRIKKVYGKDKDGEPLNTPHDMYESANNADDLVNAFNQITIFLGRPMEDVIVRDYIDPRYKLIMPSGATYNAATKIWSWVDGSYNVTYNEETRCIEWDIGRITQQTDYKSIVYIERQDDFYGGDDNETNGSDSGLYVPDTTGGGDGDFYPFPEPKEDLPFIPQTVTLDYYDHLWRGESMLEVNKLNATSTNPSEYAKEAEEFIVKTIFNPKEYVYNSIDKVAWYNESNVEVPFPGNSYVPSKDQEIFTYRVVMKNRKGETATYAGEYILQIHDPEIAIDTHYFIAGEKVSDAYTESEVNSKINLSVPGTMDAAVKTLLTPRLPAIQTNAKFAKATYNSQTYDSWSAFGAAITDPAATTATYKAANGTHQFAPDVTVSFHIVRPEATANTVYLLPGEVLNTVGDYSSVTYAGDRVVLTLPSSVAGLPEATKIEQRFANTYKSSGLTYGAGYATDISGEVILSSTGEQKTLPAGTFLKNGVSVCTSYPDVQIKAPVLNHKTERLNVFSGRKVNQMTAHSAVTTLKSNATTTVAEPTATWWTAADSSSTGFANLKTRFDGTYKSLLQYSVSDKSLITPPYAAIDTDMGNWAPIKDYDLPVSVSFNSNNVGTTVQEVRLTKGGLTITHTADPDANVGGKQQKFLFKIEYTPDNTSLPSTVFYEVIEGSGSRTFVNMPAGTYKVTKMPWASAYLDSSSATDMGSKTLNTTTPSITFTNTSTKQTVKFSKVIDDKENTFS